MSESEDELQNLQEMLTESNIPVGQVSGWDDDNDGIEEQNPDESPTAKILWAAETGNLAIVKEILSSNPELVNTQDNDGYTPLHRACYNNCADVVQLLLDHGANVSACTKEKWQPLHSACHWSNAESAALLIRYGADVNAKTEGAVTPLHLAAQQGRAKNTLELLLTNPNIDPNITNKAGEKALDIALRSGKLAYLFEMVEPCFNEI